ncbi:MAG: hypothetical protein P4L84_16720 [Isosphaeraceae bacterium]|nr:hypothetical protein [Isosphaeraceae bacterium]
MFDFITRELSGRGVAALAAFVLGGLASWAIGRWRRMRQKQSILRGDARDTVVIEHHIVERAEVADPAQPDQARPVAATLRVRALGQAEVSWVVPNGHLAAELHARALKATARQTLISMEGAEGSFLLETLSGFVGDRLGTAPFEHDLYVMAPCCEPVELAHHQPVVIVLIAAADLALFNSWPACRNIQVEHGSDGARVLTLLELARRHREEQAKIAQLRREGKRTLYAETMYVLDLALDRRTAPIRTKPVPWGRFEDVLKGMGLE